MLAWLKQVVAITVFNLRAVRQRLGASLVTVIGIAGVVMVFVAVMSIAQGFRRTLASTGDEDNVMVLRQGSTSEMISGLTLDGAQVVKSAPGVLRREGESVASAELFVIVDLPKKSTGTPVNVPLRGIEPSGFEVRRDFRVIEGRRFEPGKNELIAGRAAAREFAGLEIGNRISWGEIEWTVVGVFETGGTAEDGEIWCDARVLQPAYGRGSTFQSVHAKLESPAAFDTFVAALEDDPRVDVQVFRESEYYESQSTLMTALIRGLGGAIALLMGFGAVFGALNTMYSAVAARTREIATLRALGFGTGPVVASVLVEALALAAAGGLLGAGVAYLLFNGFQAATLNFQTFSQVAFAFAVTPLLMLGGLVYALAMGLVGGLLPAIRAARLPVASALREL